MTTQTTGDTTDRVRQRAARGIGRAASAGSQARLPAPPRQRRPAMAALAVLLIVGGALVAGLLAVRMDSREPVLSVRADIPAGTQIEAADLREVQVASEGLDLIPAAQSAEVVGTYARSRILAGQLLDVRMLTRESPVTADGEHAIVSVVLTPGLAPDTEVTDGDVVMVIRAATEAGNERGEAITEAYVLERTRASRDDFGGGTAGSLVLLVPVEAAEAVVDAAGNDRAGIAVLSRDTSLDELSLSLAGD